MVVFVSLIGNASLPLGFLWTANLAHYAGQVNSEALVVINAGSFPRTGSKICPHQEVRDKVIGETNPAGDAKNACHKTS